MRQSDQNQIFELLRQIRCKDCSDIEFVGVDLHVKYDFNQIVYEVDKRQIHIHPTPGDHDLYKPASTLSEDASI